MAELSRFFNGPSYTAGEFAEYFSRFLTDGVYVQNGNIDLKVSAGSGMSVDIDTGYAFIKGYMYKNDAVLTKTISTADDTLDRIDRVVLKFDEVNKIIGVVIKKGSLASSPIAPSLENTDTLKEISLAQIRIKKGVTSINQSDITDERVSEFGGIVSSLITIPVEDLWNAWNSNLQSIQDEWNAWYQNATSNVINPGLIQQDENNRFITDLLLSKLNGIDSGANKYVHPSSHSLDMITETSLKKVMTAAERSKLSGIESGANRYIHPGGGTNPHGTTKSDVGLGNVDNTKQMPLSGSTFTGVAKAQSNTSYTTAQLRNTIMSPNDPSGGSNGDIWIKYV